MGWSIGSRRLGRGWPLRIAALVICSVVFGAVPIAAGGAARSSHSGFRVTRSELRRQGRPADPPIGVRLETLSGDPAGAVVIDGKTMPQTSDRNGIFEVVLDRRTRDRIESGTVPRDTAGLERIHDIEKKRADLKDDGSLMIVSGTKGVPNEQALNSLASIAKELGADTLTAGERARLLAGSAFSIVGIPGGASGGAWTRVAQRSAGGSGDITGWLQFNAPIGMYDYVPGDDVSFHTAAGPEPLSARIQVNGKSYDGVIRGANNRNGFMILTLNAQTLDLISNETVSTDKSPVGQQSLAKALQKTLTPPGDATNSPRLVFVQSIGRPKLGWASWPEATNAIVDLGGTALAINNLNGNSDYTLIGGANPYQDPILASRRPGSAIEFGKILGQPGPVQGLLARGHNLAYGPVVAGPPGGNDVELARIEYQPSKPFPEFTAAEKKAETYIGKAIDLCAQTAVSCGFRTAYGDNYQAAWTQFAIDLANDPVKDYPGDGHGFNAAEYKSVLTTLEKEISMVNKVHHYFSYLQDFFEKAGGERGIDVEAVGKGIYDSVSPGQGPATSFTLGLVSKLALLGTFYPPPISTASSGVSAVFGLSAYLTDPRGKPLLADPIHTKADELARQLKDRIGEVADSMTTQARIIVSDYGKLTEINRLLPTDAWRLPPDPREALPALRLAFQRQFAEALVPVAFPVLIRATPPPLGPTDTNGIVCNILDPVTGHRDEVNPWNFQPSNAQLRAIQGWGSDRQPYSPVWFFSRHPRIDPDITKSNANTISQAGADLLFNPVNQRTGSLGINPYEFLSPKYFGPFKSANQDTDCSSTQH